MKKGGLSFGDDEDENNTTTEVSRASSMAVQDGSAPPTDTEGPSDSSSTIFKKKSLRPNSSVGLQPKAMTKSAMLKEAQLKEQLRKEYTQIQEAVKATEFVIPFVFYHGKNVSGGKVRLKKGDKIWLFLERARKVGADLPGSGLNNRRDWARISVDDLMIVKGDLIIPPVRAPNAISTCILTLTFKSSITTSTTSSSTKALVTPALCFHTPP